MSPMSTSDLKLLFSLPKIVINFTLVSLGVDVAGVFFVERKNFTLMYLN